VPEGTTHKTQELFRSLLDALRMLHAAAHLFEQGFQIFAVPHGVRCRFRV
jgi:hypothetical protein